MLKIHGQLGRALRYEATYRCRDGDPPKDGYYQRNALKTCASDRDGDCTHALCPQLRDGEPAKSGRHCPLDTDRERA